MKKCKVDSSAESVYRPILLKMYTEHLEALSQEQNAWDRSCLNKGTWQRAVVHKFKIMCLLQIEGFGNPALSKSVVVIFLT